MQELWIVVLNVASARWSYANNSNNCNEHVTISPASDETDLTDCFGEDGASLSISHNKVQAL